MGALFSVGAFAAVSVIAYLSCMKGFAAQAQSGSVFVGAFWILFLPLMIGLIVGQNAGQGLFLIEVDRSAALAYGVVSAVVGIGLGAMMVPASRVGRVK